MGTRRMNDRKPDFGGSGKHGEIFPNEVHVKHMKSGDGAGSIHDYPDREEEIVRWQDHSIKKAEGEKLKAGFRN
ncbi:MAG TPA: hypothetical protein VFX43_09360 [Chitinophagaceae bacterium]|nr:hypothetical protein [Chitinophagaceae bacterium]